MHLTPDVEAKVIAAAIPAKRRPTTTPKPAGKAKRSKYRNQRCEVDGVTFDSRKEAARWVELKAMESARVIAALRRQVRIPIVVRGVRVCVYVCDFRYVAHNPTRLVIEDVKSDFTRRLPVYRLKKKLLKAAHGIDITEI
jgi:hypothetical protein